MGLLSTPTVSSVPGEYNYFSAGAKVVITAGASGYSFNWIHECMGSCICVYVCVIKLMRSCEYVLPCMYTAQCRDMALPYTCMESSFLPLLLP